MTVLRLQNGDGLDHPDLRNLFEAAYSYSVFGSIVVEAATDDIRGIIEDPLFGVFVGFEDHKPTTLCIIGLPQSSLSPNPQCTVFFNAGSPEIRDATIREAVAFVKDRGYIKVWALNGSGHSDEAWQKVFSAAGSAGKIASLIEIDLGET